MSKEIGRREAARRFLTVLGAAAIAPAALAACGDDGEGELSCMDTTGLQPAAVSLREQQNYTDASTTEGQSCATCNFYTAPAADGCGTCSVLMRSPVHPDGNCGLWAASA